MALWGRRTFRDTDGVRVAGVWRPIFTRHGDTYVLGDLIIYADGAIDCGTVGLTDLDGLCEELRCGRVATELEDGAPVHAHHVGDWRFAEPHAAVDADMLIGEVIDEIDRLNNRPDSVERCQHALATYLDDPTEDNRVALLEGYAAIPVHLSLYVVKDIHSLWTLMTNPGKPLLEWLGNPTVTEEQHAQGLDQLREQFRRFNRSSTEWHTRQQADGPEHPQAATLTIQPRAYPRGYPDTPDVEALQNDYPATITIGGQNYPTVTHAYWALSTSDADAHDRIAAAPSDRDAVDLAARAPRRHGWPETRLAVMAALLRAKFTQHPRLAQVLLATHDARIIYTRFESDCWTDGPNGANWIGRLLELIRSELAAARISVPHAPDAPHHQGYH